MSAGRRVRRKGDAGTVGRAVLFGERAPQRARGHIKFKRKAGVYKAWSGSGGARVCLRLSQPDLPRPRPPRRAGPRGCGPGRAPRVRVPRQHRGTGGSCEWRGGFILWSFYTEHKPRPRATPRAYRTLHGELTHNTTPVYCMLVPFTIPRPLTRQPPPATLYESLSGWDRGSGTSSRRPYL